MMFHYQLTVPCGKTVNLVRTPPTLRPQTCCRRVATPATQTVNTDGTITYSFGASGSPDITPPANVETQAKKSSTGKKAPKTTAATPAPAQKQLVGEYPDPAFCEAVLSKFPSPDGLCTAEEARVLYSANYTFIDVRSAEELDSEGKILPKMPRVFHIPIVNFTKRYDGTKGRKVVEKIVNDGFVAKVEKSVPKKDQGVILVCSGVPSQGEVRSTMAMQKLRDAGYTNVVALKAGYAEWAMKFTNKLERRVVGFVIASGGTSIEQKGGMSSKGSGVSGKSAEDLLQEQLANYGPGGVYSDD